MGLPSPHDNEEIEGSYFMLPVSQLSTKISFKLTQDFHCQHLCFINNLCIMGNQFISLSQPFVYREKSFIRRWPFLKPLLDNF